MPTPDKHPVEDTRRIATIAAFFIAAMPLYFIGPRLIGMAFGASDPTGLDVDGQVAMIVEYPYVYGSLGILSLIAGFAFMVLALAFHGPLRTAAPFGMRLATTTGVLGGALFFLAGFGPMVTANWMVEYDSQNHALAVALYVIGQRIVDQLTVASMVLLGVFIAEVSSVGAHAGLLPRKLPYLGYVVLMAFAASVVVDVIGLAGVLLMIVWSAWVGVALLRQTRANTPPWGAAPARLGTAETSKPPLANPVIGHDHVNGTSAK